MVKRLSGKVVKEIGIVASAISKEDISFHHDTSIFCLPLGAILLGFD
jgi:hypothetical protein